MGGGGGCVCISGFSALLYHLPFQESLEEVLWGFRSNLHWRISPGNYFCKNLRVITPYGDGGLMMFYFSYTSRGRARVWVQVYIRGVCMVISSAIILQGICHFRVGFLVFVLHIFAPFNII